MAPVQRVFGQAERDRARDLGEAQRHLAEAEARLVELRTYHGEYLGAFRKRVEDGTSIRALRDFQAFLARLESAMQQQQQLVAQAREQAAGSRVSWQSAAHQVKAVDTVVDRWQQGEARAQDRRDQKDSDDRAQRMASGARSGREE